MTFVVVSDRQKESVLNISTALDVQIVLELSQTIFEQEQVLRKRS